MSLQLEPIGEDDFSRLIEWAHSATFLMQWAGPKFTYPLTVEQLEEHLKGAREEPPQRLVLKVVAPADGSVIGHVELDGLDLAEGKAFLARVLVAPDVRRRGFGRAIVREALRIAFGRLGLHRVELNVFEGNEPAIQLYEALGFHKTDDPAMTRRVSGHEWRVRRMAIERVDWARSRPVSKSG